MEKVFNLREKKGTLLADLTTTTVKKKTTVQGGNEVQQSKVSQIFHFTVTQTIISIHRCAL